ncbi:MAG: host attachment protein [Planctomycetota bacterium]|jgi:protein required for attachment to host cells
MKRNRLIVIANGGLTRFLALAEESRNLNTPPRLHELEEMANPEHRAFLQETYTSKQGANRVVGGGPAHQYDDRREHHDDVTLQRFARAIVKRFRTLAEARGVQAVTVAAPPQMLGHLRDELTSHGSAELQVDELPKDLTKLSVAELHDFLAGKGVIPGRQRIKG